jgi:hypothetical protein
LAEPQQSTPLGLNLIPNTGPNMTMVDPASHPRRQISKLVRRFPVQAAIELGTTHHAKKPHIAVCVVAVLAIVQSQCPINRFIVPPNDPFVVSRPTQLPPAGAAKTAVWVRYQIA